MGRLFLSCNFTKQDGIFLLVYLLAPGIIRNGKLLEVEVTTDPFSVQMRSPNKEAPLLLEIIEII